MRQDEVYKGRVEKVDGRQAKFQENVEAISKVAEGEDQSQTRLEAVGGNYAAVLPPIVTQADGTKEASRELIVKNTGEIAAEEDTDVALHINKERPSGHDSEFEMFFNNVQARFAIAIEERNEVSKAYSVPRATKIAGKIGFKADWALDLCTNDENCNH